MLFSSEGQKLISSVRISGAYLKVIENNFIKTKNIVKFIKRDTHTERERETQTEERNKRILYKGREQEEKKKTIPIYGREAQRTKKKK